VTGEGLDAFLEATGAIRIAEGETGTVDDLLTIEMAGSPSLQQMAGLARLHREFKPTAIEVGSTRNIESYRLFHTFGEMQRHFDEWAKSRLCNNQI